MAAFRSLTALTALAVMLTACAGESGSGPALTRALLPPTEPVPAASTTTTTARSPVHTADADREARTELSAVLAAGEHLFSQWGTFDATLDEVADLVPGVTVIPLEEAALRPGVVYDAHDQRLTLHRRSAGGRWFCVDRAEDITDYGYGDTFTESLDSCTDGRLGNGWEDTLTATGPDAGAIDALFRSLVDAAAAGDGAAAHRLFVVRAGCSAADLEAAWPPGLALIDPAGFRLDSIRISGAEATAAVSFGDLSQPEWLLVKDRSGWLHAGDPCALFGPMAGSLMNEAAADLLEEGLLAVRRSFVEQSDFAFSSDTLAERNPDLTLVATDIVEFGTLSYAGSESRGLLVTAGAPGRFYCAVESLSAATVYGEGGALDDVTTADRCLARASG